jgi:hypothetical protein
MKKGSQKEWKKSGKRELQARGFTVALFHTHTLFFLFLRELHVGPRFLRFSTLFALLIEKGKKNWAKNGGKG